MEQWFVLRTAERKETDALELVTGRVDRALWSECRILKKIKVFRSGGVLHLIDDVLFPGYLFIRTGSPKALAEELQKSREFPQLLQNEARTGRGRYRVGLGADESLIAAVAPADLSFLQNVCGEDLQKTMGITRIILNEENRIVRAEGVLNGYLDRIVKLNLHKRFAIVEIPLFNRIQPVLFGVKLPQDRAV